MPCEEDWPTTERGSTIVVYPCALPAPWPGSPDAFFIFADAVFPGASVSSSSFDASFEEPCFGFVLSIELDFADSVVAEPALTDASDPAPLIN